ncbi:hypothetical protein E4U16_000366 [Claviceps sp. LM84 group G4]|nr:hypothetical protein E4U16_000366 [Claviceps sp. LM84 group G4]
MPPLIGDEQRLCFVETTLCHVQRVQCMQMVRPERGKSWDPGPLTTEPGCRMQPNQLSAALPRTASRRVCLSAVSAVSGLWTLDSIMAHLDPSSPPPPGTTTTTTTTTTTITITITTVTTVTSMHTCHAAL